MLVIISQLLWAAFLVLWIAMSRQNVNTISTSVERESSGSRIVHLLMVAIGFALMWTGPHLYLSKPAMAKTVILDVFGLLLQVIALTFAAWGRIALGSNWSGAVTIGDGQRLVRGGPYAWVRHPIYLGFILAAIGSAIVVGRLEAIFGAVLILAAFLRKWRIEEDALRRRFGEDYEVYADHVRAFLPGPDKHRHHAEEQGEEGPADPDEQTSRERRAG
ncbi:MAG TPA: isoprenylcysteine carboxylmethyltransferase family protein [Terriglobales bacterium]